MTAPSPTPEMVEKVARAIHDHVRRGYTNFDGATSEWQEMCRRAALACIEALMEPSGEMIVAAIEEADDEYHFGGAEARGCWTAMLTRAMGR